MLDRLRNDLTAAGFTLDGIGDLLGQVASAALHREQPLAARRVVRRERSPLATLVGLWCLGEPTAPADLAEALPTLGVDGAVSLGLVTSAGPSSGTTSRPGRETTPETTPALGTDQTLRAACDLRPYGDEDSSWWVASDLGEDAHIGPLPLDHVLGIGGASATLASWTPRARVARALDLGTGCGVQSLHLAAHAGTVVATDVSRRALDFAAFNAALAGQEWELRHGSMLDPVAGERFDLVVSNPPFVITPRRADVPRYEYRDGGRAGDALVAELVAGVGAHLAPGGVAQLLANWEDHEDAPWQERVRGWVDGTGLDAWVVQRDQQDPAEYAELWARDGGLRPGDPGYDDLVAAWLDDFAERRVSAVGFGVVTLRRPTSGRAPVVEIEEAPGAITGPMGPHVLARLAAQDWLAAHDDDAVLQQRWRCAADVTEERHGRPGEEPEVILLRQGGGLGRAVRLDTLDAALVSVCDGDLDARTALAAISGLLEIPQDEALAQGARLLRRLAIDGLVVREPTD
nr:methyltransferase [Janibacter alkaliphilus]